MIIYLCNRFCCTIFYFKSVFYSEIFKLKIFNSLILFRKWGELYNMDEEKVKLKNNAILHKDKSLNRLDESFLKHIELSEYKKCELLAYWIQDFAVYHDEEREFNIAKSGIYSRGDVIKVNLGFNIGNELGGLHYCIVLNKYDNTRNGTLNVIPLTSRKDNKKYDSSSVNLGKELYNIFNEKIEKEKEKLQKILDELKEIEEISIEIQNIIEKEQKYIEKMEKEISKMEKDSIALINQITTVSKQRIFKDVIRRNVKISSESLDLIDEKIKAFFTKI